MKSNSKEPEMEWFNNGEWAGWMPKMKLVLFLFILIMGATFAAQGGQQLNAQQIARAHAHQAPGQISLDANAFATHWKQQSGLNVSVTEIYAEGSPDGMWHYYSLSYPNGASDKYTPKLSDFVVSGTTIQDFKVIKVNGKSNSNGKLNLSIGAETTSIDATAQSDYVIGILTPLWTSGQFNFTFAGRNVDPTIGACGTFGAGAYTVTADLDPGSATTCLILNGDHTSVDGQNHKIVGHAGAGNAGVYVGTLTDVNISNMNISNFTHGIWYDTGANNSLIKNITVTNGNTFGAYLLSNNNLTLRDSTIISSGAEAIALYGGGVPSWNNSIINNTIRGNYGAAAQSTFSVYWMQMNATIANNTIFGNTTDYRPGAIVLSRGVNLTRIINNTITSSGGFGVDSGDDLNTSIINNTINGTFSATVNAIRLSNGGYFNNIGAVVSGNNMSSASDTFYAIKGYAGSYNATIANNSMTGTGGGPICIYVTTLSNNWTIQNNTCLLSKGSAGAYGFYLTAASVGNFTITNNSINVSGSSAPGIELDGSSGNTITNNSIWANTTSGTDILIDSAATSNKIYYNNLTGSSNYISNANAGNTFNTTGGKGNIYANVTSGAYAGLLTSSTNNGWANGGTKYPANATNTPGLFKAGSLGNDSGPGSIPVPSIKIVTALTSTNGTVGHWAYENATANHSTSGASMVWNGSATGGTCTNVSNTTSGVNLSVVLNCSATAPSTYTANISFNDSGSPGTIFNSTSGTNTYPDNLPTLGAPSITPSPPTVSSTLSCNNGTWTDPDGDLKNASAQSWRWFDNGSLIVGQTAQTLGPSHFGFNDSIICEEHDTNSTWYLSNATTNSSAVVVADDAPGIVVDLTLQNASAGHWFNSTATVNDTLGGTNITSAVMNSTFGACSQLSNSTSGVNFTGNYNCTSTSPGTTTVYVEFKNALSGKATNTSFRTNAYPDQIPVLGAPSITPNPAFTNTSLFCNNGTWTDADGDLKNASAQSWRWFKNTALIGGQTAQSLPNTSFTLGDSIICEEHDTNSTWYLSNATTNSSAVVISDFINNTSLNSTTQEFDLYSYYSYLNFTAAPGVVINSVTASIGSGVFTAACSNVGSNYACNVSLQPTFTNSIYNTTVNWTVHSAPPGLSYDFTVNSSYNITVNASGLYNCSGSINTQAINYSFYDQSNLNAINATMSATYSITSSNGSVKITTFGSFTNISQSVCIGPGNASFSVIASENVNASGYAPVSQLDPAQLYNSTVTQRPIGLVNSTSGAYYTFQTINQFSAQISGASIFGYHLLTANNTWVFIGGQTTDSTGSAVFFLVPAQLYNFSVSASGYLPVNFSFTPASQNLIQIILKVGSSGNINNLDQIWNDTTYSITPTPGYYGSAQTIAFTVTSNTSQLLQSGISIYQLLNGVNTLVYTNSSTNATTATFSYLASPNGTYTAYPWLYHANVGNQTIGNFSVAPVTYTINTAPTGSITDIGAMLQAGTIMGAWAWYFIVILATAGVGIFVSRWDLGAGGWAGLITLWIGTFLWPGGILFSFVTIFIASSGLTVLALAVAYSTQWGG
jgi:hypothetical protein